MIPEAAVEDVARALYNRINGTHTPEWYKAAERIKDMHRKYARAALEAAAPHLMAQAWDACVASLEYPDGSKVEVASNTNPYR